ncbi:MAG: hypothetical protein AAGH53_06225 [Pseudomonadota bacterium]
MDNHRDFDRSGESGADYSDQVAAHDDAIGSASDDDAVMERVHEFGTDERRMHVRAYNHWVMLLGDKSYPSIDDLDLEGLDDFAENSVLLDFTSGIENPAISHIGSAVAEESGVGEDISYVTEIPGRSLLSRITDHYMEIIANQAPIGFEAEFVNQRDATVLYRGILLPFSSDDDSIDFVLGVINWKTLADQASTDELMLEVEQALDAQAGVGFDTPLWPDSVGEQDADHHSIDLPNVAFGRPVEGADALLKKRGSPTPSVESIPIRRDALAFSVSASAELLQDEELDFGLTVPQDEVVEPEATESEAAAPEADAALQDWLDHARDLALKAQQSEDRSRAALYRAIGRAYDVSLVAKREPEALAEILDDAGIVQQERAPMTPIVKLVFGTDYDKTRLTEYAAALSYAHRQELSLGALPEFLESYDGGLKGVVGAERRLRRPDLVGADPAQRLTNAYTLLREAPELPLENVDSGDSEFAVLVARRDASGKMIIVAALADDKVTDHVVRKVAG